MKDIKAHILSYVDAFYSVPTEDKAVRTLTDETPIGVDAGATLTDSCTVLALIHICQIIRNTVFHFTIYGSIQTYWISINKNYNVITDTVSVEFGQNKCCSLKMCDYSYIQSYDSQ